MRLEIFYKPVHARLAFQEAYNHSPYVKDGARLEIRRDGVTIVKYAVVQRPADLDHLAGLRFDEFKLHENVPHPELATAWLHARCRRA